MNELFIIRGLPGSGKSTFARKLAQRIPDAKVREADDYFTDSAGVYNFDHNKIREAHKLCQERVMNDLSRGITCIVSNTFVKHWEMEYYKDLARKFNIPYTVIHVQGDFDNVHNVPADVVERMRKNWEA